jgi:hypothetical protein
MAVAYEWDVELVEDVDEDEEKEILEHFHQTSFAECFDFVVKNPPASGTCYQIVLVRDDDDRRAWAYLEDNKALPEQFEDADGRDYAKVPKRFHDQVAKVIGE